MRSILLRIVRSPEADTYSLMRRLAARIQGKIDDHYSDYVITMMANAIPQDEKGRQLIMSILYVTRDVMTGETGSMSESWLQLIERNMAVYFFLLHYNRSDQNSQEDSYSGNPLPPRRPTMTVTTSDTPYTLSIGPANYILKLTGGQPQSINFARGSESIPNVQLASEIIIEPALNQVILDKSIGFFDDAAAQINAMGCAPQGSFAGQDTMFILPGLGYKLFLNTYSSDNGHTWRVTEVNILPPSI